uniref:Uncharacterized protein n=1 Tax=Arundo donax TaxID=35708 RepID=A0A0A8ZJA8_ARUDO
MAPHVIIKINNCIFLL